MTFADELFPQETERQSRYNVTQIEVRFVYPPEATAINRRK